MSDAPPQITVPALYVRKLHEDAIVPSYATDGAAGLDLHAYLIGHPNAREYHKGILSLVLHAPHVEFDFAGVRSPVLIPTGIAVQIPNGYEGQIRPRSGLALKHGITVLNSPGTIDADYRGELGVLLVAIGDGGAIEHGQRIAQLVIAPVARVRVEPVVHLGLSARGTGGFGSTGQ